jgi:hypothetical protein
MFSSTSTLAQHPSRLPLRCAGVFAAAVAVAFDQPALARADYNQNFYDWCMNNLDEGSDYCCENAGGVVRIGACIDPATLRVQGDQGTTPTRTFQVPTDIMAPPATAVNPGMN